MLNLIVLVLLIVKLFIFAKGDTKEKLKRARIKLGITCTVLVLETILLVKAIITNSIWIFCFLIILCEILNLVLGLLTIKEYKTKLKSDDIINKFKNEEVNEVIV